MKRTTRDAAGIFGREVDDERTWRGACADRSWVSIVQCDVYRGGAAARRVSIATAFFVGEDPERPWVLLAAAVLVDYIMFPSKIFGLFPSDPLPHKTREIIIFYHSRTECEQMFKKQTHKYLKRTQVIF